MVESNNRTQVVRFAALIALVGNILLAVGKLAFAYTSGSLALLGDGIDTSTDVLIAIMALAITSIISQPSDKKHPWGHGRAETVGTVVLAFIILLAGSQLALSALAELRSGQVRPIPETIVLYVTASSVFGKLLLALSQWKLGKKANSAMILANAKNMTGDIIISASVFLGIGAARIFSLPILDPIIALLVGIWIVKNGLSIFLEQNLELMDGNADDALYHSLFEAVKTVKGAGNPHRARIRKIASAWDIDLDIEVDGSKTVCQAHAIAEKVEKAVRERIPDVYDIMVHVEPAGAGQHPEQYGLCADDLTHHCRQINDT